ncbi:DUF4190 domain-containing protein [Diaminobutyricimonas sp. LJ205]|uniref:DUF4190 domain-containing protein n=1 Tax=Diaminobutyricimonas sp. LJ205 TaxID=2683590 RepID=UPI0012F52B13|nr:DUF4190 domain-containing protein [Diaminobutyricimonas sp. LJ205]
MTTTQTPEGAAGYQAPAGYPAGYPTQPMQAQPSQTLSILSLVAGIGSLFFGLTFIVPIAAVVLGFLARTREPAGRTMSTWGIVLGFVSMFGWVLLGLIWLIVSAPFFLFALV